ncbi:hypothetical protein Scep_025164 [Stephania cephalantha]|uniref:Uncharacterized protein n=1 Tax=Stephania cephalantha TaxID=152367 RepID=A0AAP0EK89_9MAGN
MARNKVKNLDRRVVTTCSGSSSSSEDGSKGGRKIGWRSLSKPPMENDGNKVWIPRAISGSTSSDDRKESLKSITNDGKVIRILKRGEKLDERMWIPTIISCSSSSSSDDDGDLLKAEEGETSTATTCSNVKHVIPSSCSSSSNDDYDFLKAKDGVKTSSRSFSKPKKDGKAKKNKASAKARKKKKKEENLKQGNDLNLTALQLSEEEKHEAYVGISYLKSPLPSSLPVPGTASLKLVSPPPSSLPFPWFLLPVGLLSESM